MIPEPLERIHKRVRKCGLAIDELRNLLDRMAQKGTILTKKVGKEKRYHNAQFVIGMYEFQVDRFTKDLAADFSQYFDEAHYKEMGRTKIPQLRTIPIEKSILPPEKYKVSNYDDVRKIIENVSGQIAVANCICRQNKDLEGVRCKITDLRETCLILSPSEAERYIGMGIGHPTTKEKALDILGKAQEAGLVLQPENTQRPQAFCCCCGDCCGLLATHKKFPRPADFYATNFYAEVDAELCTGCEACAERCQLGAPELVNDVAFINLNRCIGCGNCVVTCASNAIKLRKKERETVPPKDIVALWSRILSQKVGKLNMLKIGAKMLLKRQV